MKELKLLISFFGMLQLNAQKENGNSYYMFWFGYYNNASFNQKWNINTDVQHRTKNEFKQQSQTLIRTALVYKINKHVNVSVGGAHFRYYISNNVTRGEWRPWQEFGLNSVFDKVRIGNRFRVEQRFNQIIKEEKITNEYGFGWRFRYKVEFEFPLIKQNEKIHTVSFCNEYFMSVGKESHNLFDQNRSFISFNYQLSKNVKLLFQYMYILQYQESKALYDKVSVIRFNVFHTIAHGSTTSK